MLDIFQTETLSETRQSEFAQRPEPTTFENTGISRTASSRHLLKSHHRRPMGRMPPQDHRLRNLQTAIGAKHGRKN
jgi:hypothetical protein